MINISSVKVQTSSVNKTSPVIAVAGIGGGGSNAVDNMAGLGGCNFVICNTDAQALERSPCASKIQLGSNLTGGLGAGSKPEVGRAAAEESLDEVMAHLEGANMVFVTAGMGGGTGTGAAPVIARACRERGILTVGVVTKPFHFEGSHRMRSAEAGIKELQQYVDTLIVIPNQNLFRVANEKTTFSEAFRMADDVLQAGVRGVTDLISRPGLVNLDFADIRTAMLEMGKAMMGTGEAHGDRRAIEAAEAAINNPLLDDVSMKGARGVIINVTGGYDMTLFEADEACNRIRDEVDPDANIIFGATFDENMDGAMRVSIVATGIEKAAVAASVSGGAKEAPRGKPVFERPPATGSAAPVSAPAVARAAPMPLAAGIKKPVFQSLASTAAESAATASPDLETDLFEQSEFAVSSQGQEAGMPSNTAMRGTRYRDSFIPPRPVEPEAPDLSVSPASTAATPYYTAGFHARPSIPGAASAEAPGLRLNPPRLPLPGARKTAPSLFERLTGKVQEHLGNAPRADYDPQPQESRNFTPGPMTAPEAPSQGNLNIDRPAAAPERDGGDLDIPAFLRRQAN